MRKHKGFTLIEIVIVMAIIAILAAIIVGAIIGARRMVWETKNRNNARAIKTGFEKNYGRYAAYNGGGVVNGNFTAVAAALGVSLDTAGLNPGCTGTGGGNVTNVTASTFTITPGDWNCGGTLESYQQSN